MNSIRNLRIRSKVIAVTMLTACAALLLAGVSLLWLEVSEYRKKLERDVASLAQVIASNSVAAVSFGDTDAATEMLASLKAEPKVLAAAIYEESGQRLATFERRGSARHFPALPGPDGFRFTDDRMSYFAPIRDVREPVRIGTIYLEANFDELSDRLLSFAKLLGVVLAASGLVALGLSAALQHYIAEPIVSLAGAARRVSAEQNYELRVREQGRDELGELVASFNAMLGQIQSRDAALREARDELEARVEARTAELQQEVAERRRTQDELAHSLSLVNATLDSTADGILVVDAAGKVIGYNRKFEQLWGIPPELMSQRDDQKMIAWVVGQLADPDAFVARIAELYGTPGAESSDTIEFKNGRIIKRFSLPHRIDGRCVGRVWSFRDITERTRAEERIREQASLLDLAPDAIIVRDMNDVTLFWSKGAERLFGWPAFEAIGHDLEGLIASDAARFVEAKAAVVAHGEWSGELTHGTRDGGEVRTESRWTLLRDAEGRPKSVLTISTDVTERKQLEAQFLRAQRIESIGTLAGGIAHDLNNMLSPILVSVDLLRMKEFDANTKAILDTVEESAERGADLVRQILQFARGAEGKRVPLSLDRLVRDVSKIARDTFPKNVAFRHTIARDLWSVRGDATQLHQVLLNLCVNARDAMPEGGTLHVDVENFTSTGSPEHLRIAPAAGPHVLVRVRDTGMGIPPENRDRIFEPFFTTKELGKGTGLGLSTSAAIVKGHNGLLEFTSEHGRGTTFTLCLPAVPAAAKDVRPELAMLPGGQKEMILVVDDEASIRLVLKQTLECFGYRVIAEADGAGAVATYAQRKGEIALVLTDMMMPGMDGYATIRSLKAINPQVRAIAATGLMTDDRVLKATEAGAICLLPKPYSAEVLLRTIQQALSGTNILKLPAPSESIGCN